MFKIEKKVATITNLNVRIEKHGEERNLAIDISFSVSTSNQVLDYFDKDLRKSLFRKAAKGEQQSLPTIGEPLTEIKHPGLEPIKLSHEYKGYELQLDGELDGTQPIFLTDMKVKKFGVAAKEGGSVDLTFKTSGNVTPDEVAELTEALTRQSVVLTLQQGQANEATQQEDLAA